MNLGNIIRDFVNMPVKGFCSRLDVELILSHILQCTRENLYIHWNKKCSLDILKKYYSILKLRKTGWPMAYILGQKEFYGQGFYVAPGVFIPRPETETIITAVQTVFECAAYNCHQSLIDYNNQNWNIIDFGCGSGCIGLSLLLMLPKARLISVDLSNQALQFSKKNAQKLGLMDRVLFVNKDISNLKKQDWQHWVQKEKIHIITANPPYVAFDDPIIEKNVLQFEPPSAIFSGLKGLNHLQMWLKKAAELLDVGGHYFFEIGSGQESYFRNIQIKNLSYCSEFKDLSGYIRVMHFQKGNG